VNSVLVALIILVNVTLSVTTLARTVQRSERSRFRYEIWRLRDGIVEDLQVGRIRPTKPVLEYLDRLELNVEATDFMTPFRFGSAAALLRRTGWHVEPDDLLIRADPREREVLRVASRAVSRARIRMLLHGSPSGWVVLVLKPFIIAGVMLRELLHSRLEHREPTPPVTAVTDWSTERYGHTMQVLKPVVRPPGRDAEPEHPAYA